METETTIHDPAALLSEIAEAMRDPGLTSTRAADLAETAQRAAAQASLTAADARAAALDPSLAFEQVEAARLEADRADHDRKRIEAAMSSLAEKAAALASAEDAGARLARYRAADKEAARVAELIAAQWPDLTSRIVALLDAIMQTNALVDAANADLPPDMPKLHRPEGRARGFPDHHGLTGDGHAGIEYEILRLTSTVLPGLDPKKPLVWPPGDLHRWMFTPTGGRRFSDLLDPRVIIDLWRKSRRPRD